MLFLEAREQATQIIENVWGALENLKGHFSSTADAATASGAQIDASYAATNAMVVENEAIMKGAAAYAESYDAAIAAGAAEAEAATYAAADADKAYAAANVEAGVSSEAAGASAESGGGKMMGLATAGAAVALGVVAAFGVMAHSAMEYDKQQDMLASKAGISVQAAQQIGTAFLGTAGDVTFSADKIMAAYTPVAGQFGTTEGHALSAAEAMDVMTASMDGAEATGGDLTSTTKDLSGMLMAFGVDVRSSGLVMDTLVTTSNMLGQSIDTTAGQLEKIHSKTLTSGMGFQQLAGTMVTLTQDGVTGRAALSFMSSGLTGLITPSSGATKELDALHVKLTNASGAFIGLGPTLDALGPKFDSMTQSQRYAAEAALVGKANVGAFDDLLQGGSAAIDANTAAVSKQGAAHDAATKATDNAQAAMEKIKAAFSDVTTSLGQALLPAIGKIVTTVAPVIKTVAQWMQGHQQLAIIIMAGMGALGALLAITIAIGAAMTLIDWPVLAVVVAIAAITAATIWLLANWDHFNGFMKVLIITLGLLVAPFIAIPILIIKNWGPISSFFINLWNGIVGFVRGAVSDLGKVVSGIGSFFSGIWDGLKSAATAAWSGVVAVIKGGINDIIQAINFFIRAIDAVQVHIPSIGVGPVHSPSFDWNGVNIAQIPLLAAGGDVTAGLSYIVGDAGPELFQPSTSGTVIPNKTMSSMMSGSSGGSPIITIDLRGSQMMNDASMETLLDKIGQKFAQFVGPSAGITFRR